jgi:hypothetical protein
MRKTMIYMIGALVLLWAGKFITTTRETTTLANKTPTKVTVAQEKYIALRTAPVKWPAESKAKASKPKQPRKSSRKSKPPVAASAKNTTGKATGKTGGGGYNIVGQFNCPVDAYLDHMRRRQALVVVYDGRKKRLWELTASGTTFPIDKLPDRYSPQTRRLTDDFPNRSTVLATINTQYGPSNYEILLLVPEELDRHIKESIETIMKQHAQLSQLTAVHLTYHQNGAGFTATVDWGLVNGRRVAIDQTFLL